MRRGKREAGHAQRKAKEAGFRHKASAKDGAKSVQSENESPDEHCKEKNREIATGSVRNESWFGTGMGLIEAADEDGTESLDPVSETIPFGGIEDGGG